MLTNVYHIIYFKKFDLAYLFFHGCNFQCRGCILKNTPWDYHLSPEVRSTLSSLYPDPEKVRLTFKKFKEVMDSFYKAHGTIERVALGGAEPLLDRQLLNIASFLKERSRNVMLLTNGFLLTRDVAEELIRRGVNEVTVSIKAYSESKHVFYTSVSNRRVIENLKAISRLPIKIYLETVLIPGFVEEDELEQIAMLIRSLGRDDIVWTINDYYPVKGLPWRRPTREEVTRAIDAVRRYYDKVVFLPTTYPVGEIEVVYPPLRQGT